MDFSKLSKESLKEMKSQIEDALVEKESIIGKDITWKKAITLMEKESTHDFLGNFFVDNNNSVCFNMRISKTFLHYIK
jgi:hypothetical protein